MARRSISRRVSAIRTGGNLIASLFERGELGLISAFAAVLRSGISPRKPLRYCSLQNRRTRNQLNRAVDRLLNQLSQDIQRSAVKALTEEYVATAREIESFADGLQADSDALDLEAQRVSAEVLNDMSVTFETELRYMRRDADDLYRQIIEAEAENREATSATLNSAVQNAMRRFAENGITGFTDIAGRNWGIYEYTNMAMRTAIHRASLQATLNTMSRIGIDLCFVQRHTGACPKCASWYGKILSASGLSDEYPSLQQAMDAGLFHPNCCDILQVYIPGKSDLDAGMGGFTDDVSAARYAASQRQRALERECRRWKRIQAAALIPEEERTAKAHVDLLQHRLRALTGEYDLPRRYDREGGRVRLSESARKIKPFTVDENGRVIADRAVKQEDGISFGARTAIYNTGRQVYFNPEASYSVMLDGYSDEVNAGISKAARDVALKGSESRTEHMYLVNLKTGELEFYETNNESSSVGYMFYKHLTEHPDGKYAFVHNHNTDSAFSETDMRTLLTVEGAPIMLAVRDDGIIYVAERNGGVQTNGDFDSMYENDLEELNQKLRSGIITMSKRTKERERIIVENLLRDYTKGGKLIEFD